MAKMDKVFGAIPKGSEESIRGLAGSTLASGAPVDVGTQILPKAKEITIAGSDDFAITGSNQSDRAQVPPSTTNKIPRIYGNVTTGGVVIDAQKSGANTVFVAMALSMTDPINFDQVINDFDSEDLGPPWGIYEIYRGDAVCEMQANVFTLGNAEPYGATASTVQKLVSIQDGSNVDVSSANVINVWAWQHTANTTNQIFPYYPPGSTYRQNAWDVMPGWSNTDTCDGLVTVIVEVDQDETLDIKEFGNFKFKVGTRGYYEKQANGTVRTFSLTNPAYALEDYVLRLGYGEFSLSPDFFDSTSINEWAAYCDETYYYAVPTGETDVLGGTSYGTYGSYDVYSTERWQINGFINTKNKLGDNITSIAQAGQGSFTYDNRAGKFKVLINKPITNAEGANAFVFDNTNIISGVQYNSTDLYSLFNYADATFPNTQQQDFADTVIVKTPTADQVTNELPSAMNFQVDTVNDRPRASQMANNSLKASRVANMASFSADYSTFNVKVGDFVKITESGKGWNEKLFKVLRITESQDEDGTTSLGYNCIEHRPSTYEDIIYVATANEPFANGVGTVENLTVDDRLSFTDRYANVAITVPSAANAYIVVDDPTSGTGNIYYANGTISQSGVSISALDTLANISANYADYDVNNEGWIAFAASADGNVDFDYMEVEFTGDASEDSPAYNATEIISNYVTNNVGSATIWTPFKLNKLTTGTYDVSISAYKQEAVRKRSSQAETLTVTVNDRVATGNVLQDTYGPGTYLTQTTTATVDAGNSSLQTLAGPIQHDLIDINLTQDFDLTYTYKVTWTSIVANTDDVAFGLSGNITFVNTANTSTQVFPITGGGIQYNNITSTQAVNTLNRTFTHTVPFSGRAELYGLDADEWYPSKANVSFIGYNSATGGDFTDISYEMRSQNRFYRS